MFICEQMPCAIDEGAGYRRPGEISKSFFLAAEKRTWATLDYWAINSERAPNLEEEIDLLLTELGVGA